jgi:hypothetical protein
MTNEEKIIAEISAENPNMELNIKNCIEFLDDKGGLSVVDVHKVKTNLTKDNVIGIYLYRNEEMLAKTFIFLEYGDKKAVITKRIWDGKETGFYTIRIKK